MKAFCLDLFSLKISACNHFYLFCDQLLHVCSTSTRMQLRKCNGLIFGSHKGTVLHDHVMMGPLPVRSRDVIQNGGNQLKATLSPLGCKERPSLLCLHNHDRQHRFTVFFALDKERFLPLEASYDNCLMDLPS